MNPERNTRGRHSHDPGRRGKVQSLDQADRLRSNPGSASRATTWKQWNRFCHKPESRSTTNDQLGVGNSDIPDDPALWTLPRCLTELEEVRQGLGLDHFVLYGHSCGGMLALEYALNLSAAVARPGNIQHDCGHSVLTQADGALKSQMLLPESLKQFDALEASKDYDNPAYERIVMEELYPKLICRLKPNPEPVSRTEIKVKALTIGANYDEMDPADMQKMATMMPHAARSPWRNPVCLRGDIETAAGRDGTTLGPDV